VLIVAYDLAKILFLKESFRLHLIKNPAPAFAALESGDLISAQARAAAGRLRLRRKKGVGDLLVARREALKSAGAGAGARATGTSLFQMPTGSKSETSGVE
jgi:hypothetical protein